MIPLHHDFRGKTVLVFGGGPVGARKAQRFAREARVVVVSPEFSDTDFESEGASAGQVAFVRAAPTPDGVAGWFDRVAPALVVAATDDADLNAAIAAEAAERGILHNRADRSGTDRRPVGEVVVPATVRDEPVVASLATGGASPALSKHLRERLEDELAGAGAMAELTGDLRADLQERGVDPDLRRTAVRRVVRDSGVWKALGTGGANARERATEVVAEVVGDE
ncbi:precorrin-2 dehydrogenase/sirohydrochlorin ferrochelatase family protein [Haloglomus litoreum]|uniref:precorrin-2 dehydrogenase/sirohydrochlorin ferrochelatase family protein n=1 Tax=Haloglomus litoreum TaxID=3034026 RepID=UPI0023E8432D|nr:bifunctional precorrin-2 dehydrogenase/sirohydrochlorin ferrochelatase [Haloglomus sp. DT116]